MNSEKIGKIEKPEASRYFGKKKIFIVKFFPSAGNVEDEFIKLVRNYVDAVLKNLENLEKKIGLVKHIFIDGLPGKGEDLRVAMDNGYPLFSPLIKAKLALGATLDQFEDKDSFFEFYDWMRVADLRFTSKKVAALIEANYRQSLEERNKHQTKYLKSTMKKGSSGLLLTSDTQITLPSDFERFIVAPPEMDKVEQWIKNKLEEYVKAANQSKIDGQSRSQKHTEKEQSEETEAPKSKLWVPD